MVCVSAAGQCGFDHPSLGGRVREDKDEDEHEDQDNDEDKDDDQDDDGDVDACAGEDEGSDEVCDESQLQIYIDEIKDKCIYTCDI